MRERLIIAFVALAVGIIAVYGIPRAYIVANLIQTNEERRVDRAAEFMSVLVEEREAHADVTEQFLGSVLHPGEHVTYVAADGTTVEAGDPTASGDLSATADVPGGGTVEFSRSGALISQRVQDAVMPVVLLGIVLMIVSGIVAVVLARRLSAPFLKLASLARKVGEGSVADEATIARMPEARAIEEAMRESARTLEQRIRREHEFAANASHQLRTPITALRLELEDVSLWPETAPEVRAQLEHALREIDRLSDAIAQLLALARGATPGADDWIALGPLLTHAGERWRAQASEHGREIRVESGGVATTSVPAPSGQILDVLIHNALQHGRGVVTVSGTRANGYVTVRVGDEGPRPSGNSVFQRTPGKSTNGGEGIGLALSAELAEALGGHLLLESTPMTRFSLILPQHDA